jgi:hypothetical protein
MGLDYEFAPIDVDIISHPKAFMAGVEAMGMWLWGQAHCKLHNTGGRISRAAALAAWGGRRNVMLIKKLVGAGLWVAREDGDWDVWNHDRKTPGGSSSADRMRKLRAKRRDEADVTGDTLSDTQSDVTKRHRCSPSPSVSLSASDLPPIASVTEAGAVVEPPAWFVTAIEVIAMNTGVALPACEAWLRYEGHRAGKGIEPTAKDAQYWLTTVMVPEAREVTRRASRDADRDAKFASRGPLVQPVASGGRAWSAGGTPP